MHTELVTLSNGLRVIFIDTKAFPTITSLLLVGAGSRYELKGNNGIAHFLEHMFYKGSKNYPNQEIISQIIEGMGGHWNAFTSKDYTGYYIKAASSHFPKMIDIISDLLLNSLFDPKEIEKEKGVIVEEINMYEDMPQRRISEIFENVMFPNSPLGYDIAGTKETVTSFDRNTFVDYMKSLYQPQNAVLIVAGGLSSSPSGLREKSSRVNSSSESEDSNRNSRDFSRIPSGISKEEKFAQTTDSNNFSSSFASYLAIINKSFGSWKQQKINSFKKFTDVQKKARVHVSHKKTEQAHFCLGFRTFANTDKRRPVLKVLATILGGGASSRLFQEVREKRGLCYYIGTGLEQYQDIGNIVTQSGVAKDVHKVKEAVKATLIEHKKIASGQINSDDIIRSKEMLKGRLLLSLEDSFNVAHFYGMKQLHEGKIQSPEKIIEEIERVTVKEIVALAKELFVMEKLNFAIIGPFVKKDFDLQDMDGLK